MVVLLVCVTADGDDADGGAGRVGDDDGLSGDVVLVLVVAGGAGSLLRLISPPAASAATALRGREDGGGDVLEHGATWGRVLLHPFGALRGQHGLRGRHLVGRHVPCRERERCGSECQTARRVTTLMITHGGAGVPGRHLVLLVLFGRGVAVARRLPHNVRHSHIQRLVGWKRDMPRE